MTATPAADVQNYPAEKHQGIPLDALEVGVNIIKLGIGMGITHVRGVYAQGRAINIL